MYQKGYNLNDLVIMKNHRTSGGGGELRNHYQGPQEIRHNNELLPWRRRKLQHEMQREDKEDNVVLPDEQSVVNLRHH